MIVFLESLGSQVAKSISKQFVKPNSDEEPWSKTTIKEYEANIKATYALMKALNDNDLSRVINCTFAYDIWQNLIITREKNISSKEGKN